jgi:NAD-dependent deacetylase
VWFGEVPFEMDRIERELARCDVFVTIGSSGSVYPAAGFVAAIRRRAASVVRDVARPTRSVYLGPEPPANAQLFDECRLGGAAEAVPRLFDVAGSSPT